MSSPPIATYNPPANLMPLLLRPDASKEAAAPSLPPLVDPRVAVISENIHVLNSTAVPHDHWAPHEAQMDFYVGLFLALLSSLFIGTSFILKKKGLLRTAARGKRAADGAAYLKEPIWWAGIILMAVGESANFAAYAFAPATLVTPLGALSVLISAALSSKLLDEHLNILGKIGCLLCIIGATVMIFHAPKEQEIQRIEELAEKLMDPLFVMYACVVLVVSLILMFYHAPRYGQTNVIIYIAICSLLGSFTVMGCKAVGTAIKQTANGHNEFTNWITWFFIIQLVVCIYIQIKYLNMALDVFNTAVVTPVYYVFFTSCVIVASAILFKEWSGMPPIDIVGTMCGFANIICGIFLLNAFRDLAVSLDDLPRLRRSGTDLAATRSSSTVHDDQENLLDPMS